MGRLTVEFVSRPCTPGLGPNPMGDAAPGLPQLLHGLSAGWSDVFVSWPKVRGTACWQLDKWISRQ